jgi:hypothetical protein
MIHTGDISHVGFDKPANPNALGTLEEAIAKVNGSLNRVVKASRWLRRLLNSGLAAMRTPPTCASANVANTFS